MRSCVSGSRRAGVTLVDELVEGVLAVGTRLTPHDRSGVVIDAAAVFGDAFPVGLHVALAMAETRVSHSGRLKACSNDLRHVCFSLTCWK